MILPFTTFWDEAEGRKSFKKIPKKRMAQATKEPKIIKSSNLDFNISGAMLL